MIAAALLGALSDRARGDRLHVVESLALGENPSTKATVAYLESVATSKHVLIVIEYNDEVSRKSVRNLEAVHVLDFSQLNAYDVLVSDDIVFTRAAFEAFVAAKSRAASIGTESKEEVSA
jgi:large subunit ribosomal protein L4